MAWIYKFRIGLITALAIVLIALAVSFSVLRAVLPHAKGYVLEVQQELSEQIGLPVEINSIGTDMSWLTPRLKLLDVVIFDKTKKKELLHLDEAVFALAYFDSLLSMAPMVGDISLVGADLYIERKGEGRWTIQGIDLISDDSKDSPDELIDVLLNTNFSLLDSDIHWTDYKNNNETMDFIGVNVISNTFLGKHSFGVDLQLPDGYGDAFRFIVEASGLNDLNDLGNVNWDIFLEGESVNIKSWRPTFNLDGLPDVKGVLDGKIWLSYRNSKVESISGDVSVNAFGISSAISNREWVTDHVTAKFNVHNLVEGWRLDVKDLVLIKNGRLWGETSNLTVLSSLESGLRASATYLRLQDVLQIPSILLKDEEMPEMEGLQLAKVSGDVYNVEVVIPSSEKFKPEAKGVFKDFDFTIPGSEIVVDGADGAFHYKEGQAKLELLSESVEINFGSLFRQPIQANLIEGTVSAIKNNARWVVTSPDIYIQNDDVETNTRFEAIVKGNGAIIVDVQTDFSNAVAESVKKYFPVPIMSNSLLDWLDDAFIDGVIESGSFILHGDVSQFPYANYDGVLEVVFNVHDLTLHFIDEWPDLEDMAGDVYFYNSSLLIENATGRTYNGIMRQAKATIDDFQSPHLLMQGIVEAPVNDLQKYVFNSGLDEILGAAMRLFHASGEARLDLSLGVPLDKAEVTVETQGKLKFTNNELYFPIMDYAFSDVTGDLSFVGNDISGSGVTASFEGAPLKIDVKGNGGNPSRGTVFNIVGNVPIDGLLKKFNWIPGAWASGSSEWDIDVYLPGANDVYSVKIDMLSELDGVELSLSDALSKASDEILTTSVGVKVTGDVLQANLKMNDDISLFGTRDKEMVWSFFVDSKLVKGKGKFTEDLNKDSTAYLDFKYIDLLTLFKAEGAGKSVNLAPTFFPSLDVNAKTLIWDNWEFNNVHVETSWQPQGMLINALSLQGPSLDITGQGSWLSAWKGKHESNFKFNVKSSNLGHTLSTMGFTDSLSRCEQVATVDWQWPAEPYGFSLATISGSSHFELKDGQVKDVKPGTGGRVLGLLNVFKLHERLLSGFGDVYKEGFVFDSIEGDFEFHNGNAVTDNIQLTAKAADMGIAGRIGIVKKDYDLVMQVSPHSTAATLTAGTLMGGPVIGTGLVLLKKLFGVDEMLHDEYTVTGSWSKPDVKLVSAHDETIVEPVDESDDDLE